MQALTHPFSPVYNEDSRILILGSFPSPRSRSFGFYYAYPQNAFWRVLAETLGKPQPEKDIPSRIEFLLDNKIALWDVIHSCDIVGASDSSIKNPIPNKFRPIIEESKIHTVFTTGRVATDLFNSLAADEAGLHGYYLPSTSSANRSRWGSAEFKARWSQVYAALNE